MLSYAQGWTYHSSPHTMTYENSFKYCKEKYTAMVAIQNKKENEYLNSFLDFNGAYYWIGIRKDKNTRQWTWVGTNKTLTEEAKNWATNEPNNLNEDKNEDCVEMYVKRAVDAGKWNDIACNKKKIALCYTASCTPMACSNHGECVETINNYTCSCYDGYYGTQCEHVVTCPEINDIRHGSVMCSHVNERFSYQSSCNFSCPNGYVLAGSENLQCTSSGDWDNQIPHCKASCTPMACSNHGECVETINNYTCSCYDGYYGTQCEHVVTCPEINDIRHGSVMCSHVNERFSYQSSCNFSCPNGYVLAGSENLQCTSSGDWDNQIPHCKASCTPMACSNHGECVETINNYTCSCYDGYYGTQCEHVTAGKSASYLTVGIISTSISVTSAASLLIWIVKRIRKTGKQFSPSSYEHLEDVGVYQNTKDSNGAIKNMAFEV
ncbi:L-selectin [Gastrophryne carolinensis]